MTYKEVSLGLTCLNNARRHLMESRGLETSLDDPIYGVSSKLWPDDWGYDAASNPVILISRAEGELLFAGFNATQKLFQPSAGDTYVTR